MIASAETLHSYPSEKTIKKQKKHLQGFQFEALCEAEGLDPQK